MKRNPVHGPRAYASDTVGRVPSRTKETHTVNRVIRVPDGIWNAYERVCKRLGRSRAEDLLAHMRRTIKRHGDEQDLADLAAGEAELAANRANKGGRPRRDRAHDDSPGS